MNWKSPLVVGAWTTAVVTLLGVGYAAVKPTFNQNAITTSQETSTVQLVKMGCQVIATDPKPPLNVRSSPVVATDNMVGNISNGTLLSVVDEQEGWLRISSPLQGWIHRSLTVTSCDQNPDKDMKSANADLVSTPFALEGQNHLKAAREKYQRGDLQGAIERLQRVQAADPAHAEAEGLIKTMPLEWQKASLTVQRAENFLKKSRPQGVLALAVEVPDIQYWRSQMAPLVKAAMIQQHRRLQAQPQLQQS